MSATIKYKGNTIASITTDSSKTLKTSGKYCEGDIVVENVQDGGGGSELPFELESVTEYVHAEDWTSDALGNSYHFSTVYCNGLDTTDRRLYVCYITNNTAIQNYRANFVTYQRYGEVKSSVACINARNNWSNLHNGANESRSFYLSAGSIVKVFVFKFGGIL